jgi:Polyketide cyclase / dehydrase and lipid transport
MELPHHFEFSAPIPAPAEQVFAYVDDHTRLSSHMNRSSWWMGGGRMEIELDDGRGQRVGSRIRLKGHIFGFDLSVEEAVTERNPPRRKVWETVGTPRLLVIGHYRMGFEISPEERASILRVFIHYELPDNKPARWLGYLFGRQYAKWCTNQMVEDTSSHFASLASGATCACRKPLDYQP